MAELGPIGLTGAQARVDPAPRGRRSPVADGRHRRLVGGRAPDGHHVVDDLEEAGLIARATDPKDRRSVLVSLTEKGRLLLDEVAHARRRTAEATFSQLSQSERAELMRLLAACCGPCGCRQAQVAPTATQASAAHAPGEGQVSDDSRSWATAVATGRSCATGP